MASLDKFLEELKAFFKNVNHFLTDTVEGYSMSDVDDKERDSLVLTINSLENLMSKFTSMDDMSLPPPPDEIYDDTLEPNNNGPKENYFQPVGSPEVEEYLAPNQVSRPEAYQNKEPDGTITEDTYEDPYADRQNQMANVAAEEQGIMEDTYEDPYADRFKASANGSNNDENEGIMEDMYEDPYADGKRKIPPSDGSKTEDEGDEEMYENPDEKKDLKKNASKKKKEKHDKKHHTKVQKEKKDRKQSDTKSECSSEESSTKDIPASELADAPFSGFLKKLRAKDSWLKKKNRWCAIRDNMLYYYESKNSKVQKGSIPLKIYEASEVKEEVAKKKYVFQLTCPGRKSYFFTTSQSEDMKIWIHYINKGELPPTEEPVDDSGEMYEDTEDPLPSPGNNNNDDDDEGGIMEETYEDPEPYVKKEFLHDIKKEEDEVARPTPPLPRRDDSQGVPPPILPRREDGHGGMGKAVPDIPDPQDGGIMEETYDDAFSGVQESDDYYDDGTSVPMVQTRIKKPLPPTPPPKTKPDDTQISSANSPTSNPNNPPEEKSINYEAMYYGIWSCENVSVDELEFKRGDHIEILNKDKYDKDGWWVGKFGKKVGLVPIKYVTPMYKEI